MPDSSGRLTPEDHQKIQIWWSKHWSAPVICPVCKTSEWVLADHVVNIVRHGTDAQVGASYPHIIVGCKTCAHAMFFNAVSIGVAVAWEPLQQPQTALGLATMGAVSDLFGPLAPSHPLASPRSLASLLKKKE